MMPSVLPGIILGGLALLAAGAMGIAISELPIMHVNSFQIVIDNDSLRTDPLTDYIEASYGNWLHSITSDCMALEVSSLEQIESATVTKKIAGNIEMTIVARRPLLKISSPSISPVCLSPDGTPFPFWPEHGELPVYSFPNDWTQDRILSPNRHTHDLYSLLVLLTQSSGRTLREFNQVVFSHEFDVVLSHPETRSRLRLSTDPSRYSDAVVQYMDELILRKNHDPHPYEFDVRFPGILIIRPIHEVENHV